MKLNPSSGKVTYKDSYNNIYTVQWSEVSNDTNNTVYRVITEIIGPMPYVAADVIERPFGRNLTKCLKTVKVQDIVVMGNNMPSDYTIVESITYETVYRHISVENQENFSSPFKYHLNNSLTDGNNDQVISGDAWGDPNNPTMGAFYNSANWISVW